MPQPTNPIASLLAVIADGDKPGVIAWMNALTHALRFGGDAEIEKIRAIAQSYLDGLPSCTKTAGSHPLAVVARQDQLFTEEGDARTEEWFHLLDSFSPEVAQALTLELINFKKTQESETILGWDGTSVIVQYQVEINSEADE